MNTGSGKHTEVYGLEINKKLRPNKFRIAYYSAGYLFYDVFAYT